jgi:hypothetical protein
MIFPAFETLSTFDIRHFQCRAGSSRWLNSENVQCRILNFEF